MDVRRCNGRQISASNSVILLFIATLIVSMGGIEPNVKFFVPPHGKEVRRLHSFHARIVDPDQSCDHGINLILVISTQQIFQLLAVREIPYFDRAISSGGDQATSFHVKSACGDLWVECLGNLRVDIRVSLKFGHQFSVLNVPDCNKASFIA